MSDVCPFKYKHRTPFGNFEGYDCKLQFMGEGICHGICVGEDICPIITKCPLIEKVYDTTIIGKENLKKLPEGESVCPIMKR